MGICSMNRIKKFIYHQGDIVSISFFLRNNFVLNVDLE